MRKLKWTAEMLNGVTRDSDKWSEFVEWQKERIHERLARYNNVDTVKTQLDEKGEPTPYQTYKINVVSKYLFKALKQMETGQYGICLTCGAEIPIQRLLIVPGALNCIACENKNL